MVKHLRVLCVLLWAVVVAPSMAEAATVDTVMTFSQAMNKNLKAVVITPASYASESAFPAVYLLHGHGGDYSNWIAKVRNLEKLADDMKLIIVCPDGGVNSWYWDSPVDPSIRYETYVAGELVKWIDSKYKTIKDRSGRAITGLSMGGHGALYLAFKHQDVFGAAGSMSGGVDIRPFPNNWGMAKWLGKYADQPDNWERHTVINLTHLLTPNTLALIIDCGTDDFFFRVNNNLHEKLLERNIPHDYIARPGGHSWPYWSNSISYQLLYFRTFFNKPKG